MAVCFKLKNSLKDLSGSYADEGHPSSYLYTTYSCFFFMRIGIRHATMLDT